MHHLSLLQEAKPLNDTLSLKGSGMHPQPLCLVQEIDLGKRYQGASSINSSTHITWKSTDFKVQSTLWCRPITTTAWESEVEESYTQSLPGLQSEIKGSL